MFFTYISSVCRSESTIDVVCEIAFYLVLLHMTFFLGKLWMSKKLVQRIHSHFLKIWLSHGPMTSVIMFFCVGDWWLKYLGGIALLLSWWFLGTECLEQFNKLDMKTVLYAFTLCCHHHGALIAFYFQPREDVFWNTLFFGHVWWIHSKGLVDDYVKRAYKYLTGSDLKPEYFEHVYAAFTVIFLALYCNYLDFGFYSYQFAAIFSMFFGRYVINLNAIKIKWMYRIETPGVIFFAFSKVLGWPFGLAFTLSFLGLNAYLRKNEKEDAVVPPRMVLNERVQEFLENYPLPERNETTLKAGLAWFDGQGWDAEKFALFRAICGGDEARVQSLIDDGADPNQQHVHWWNSKPIAWCGGGGHIGCAKILINAGVNPFVVEDGALNAAKQFSKPEFVEFYDRLASVVFEAIREEDCSAKLEKQDSSGLTWDASAELAKGKGGRLCTFEEAQEYLMGSPLFDGEDQWCAVKGKNDAERWIQVGNKSYKVGKTIQNGDMHSIENNQFLLWMVDPPKKSAMSGAGSKMD